jgi:hypothetical protein
MGTKKTTAVEWLQGEIEKFIDMGNTFTNEFEKAKAMEKEQIMDAYFSAIKITGEGWNGEYAQGNSPNIEENFMEDFNKWFEQFKNK